MPMTTEPVLSLKQAEVMRAIQSRKYDLIYLIGAIGTSKTYVEAFAMVQIAWQYPKSFIPIGRKTIAEARIGTWLSFLEVLENIGLTAGEDYKTSEGTTLRIKFSNGSIIQFAAIDRSKDPQWSKIKSINATAAAVDEVDSINREGFITFSSRTGRKNANGAPSVTIATCNPNETWFKETVYIPWRKGELPPKTLVIEFTMEDSFLYGTGYYDRYMSNPPQWQERYLKNNWEYLDDDNSLFKMRVLDKIVTDVYPTEGEKYLGVDVAREGKDRSVLAKIVGNTLVDIKVYTAQDLEKLALPEERDAPPYATILGREVYKYAMFHNIGYTKSAGDAVGNGGGLIDYLRSVQFKINEFKAGASSAENYDMLRSEIAFKLAKDMENGEFFIWSGCPFISEVKQELLLHLYSSEDKVLKVESKKKLKERLGKSPDMADSVFISYYNKKRLPDSKYNTNRLG